MPHYLYLAICQYTRDKSVYPSPRTNDRSPPFPCYLGNTLGGESEVSGLPLYSLLSVIVAQFGPHVIQNGCRNVSCYKYIVILWRFNIFRRRSNSFLIYHRVWYILSGWLRKSKLFTYILSRLLNYQMNYSNMQLFIKLYQLKSIVT